VAIVIEHNDDAQLGQMWGKNNFAFHARSNASFHPHLGYLGFYSNRDAISHFLFQPTRLPEESDQF
jgi:hypothetical protein